MMTLTIDGKTFILNDEERQHWLQTGKVKRITEGDAEDAEWLENYKEAQQQGEEALTYFLGCLPKSVLEKPKQE
jgi:hypothetical protein